MAVLTGDEIRALWRQAYVFDPQTKTDIKANGGLPPRTEIQAAFQGIEDVVAGLNLEQFVSSVTRNDADAEAAKAELGSGRIPSHLAGIVKTYLEEHPPSVTRRSINTAARDTWIASNLSRFDALNIPSPRLDALVRVLMTKRIREAL